MEETKGRSPEEKFSEGLDAVYDFIEKSLRERSGMKPDYGAVAEKFGEAEQTIAEELKKILQKENIRVEITSDDSTELYDGDWTYPPYAEVYVDGELIGAFALIAGRRQEHPSFADFVRRIKNKQGK